MMVEQLFMLLVSEPFRVLMAARGVRLYEVARLASRRATGVYVCGAKIADDREIILRDDEIEDAGEMAPIDVANYITARVRAPRRA